MSSKGLTASASAADRAPSGPQEVPASTDAAAAAESSASQEAVLIAGCRRGEAAAMTALVRSCQDRVYNACWRLCGDRHEAEDLAQEALVRALGQIGRFEGRSRFYTWVYRIAVNLAMSQRRRPRRAAVSLDSRGERGVGAGGGRDGPLASRVASDDRGPADGAAAREEQEAVAAALAKLAAEHRVVVVLRDLDGLDYDEIAEILGVPRGTVKSRLHRGRAALREMLSDRLAEDWRPAS